MIITFTKRDYPSITADETINFENIKTFWKDGKQNFPCIKFSDTQSTLYFSETYERDEAFDAINKALSTKKDNSIDTINQPQINQNMPNALTTVTDDAKSFIKEHRQAIYYIVLALIIDHFFLNGQLTAKIKNIVAGLLNKAETAITGKPATEIPAVEVKPATPQQ